MRNKELIAEMQKMQKKMKELDDYTYELRKVAVWLNCHDKNDVEIRNIFNGFISHIEARYFYEGLIKTVTIRPISGEMKHEFEVVRNSDETIIVREKISMPIGSIKAEKYYQIDKEKETSVEIPKPAFVVEKKKSSKKAKK